MILILTKKASNRVNYTIHHLIDELIGVPTRIIHDLDEYLLTAGPKFSYGVQVPDEDLYFGAENLLFETGISLKQLSYTQFEGYPAAFRIFDSKSCLPFDMFAASFYFLSRYEEYLPHLRDEHGRFVASGSEAFRNGFLQKPLINIWAKSLGKLLRERFPQLKQRKSSFKFLLSIDIDAAYSYKHKGITRSVGGLINDLQNRSFDEIRERISVLTNRQKDPYDTFEYLFQLQSANKLEIIYFILLADYGPFDKNLPVYNRQFQKLIKLLADYSDIGIHPSYASFDDSLKLKTEIARLSKILHQEVTSSRQHFLRLEFPGTYRNLLNQDILNDYTMGYAEEPGFRASVCTPFNFYDLDMDLETHLRIHPFAVMDGTLNDYMRLVPGQALEVIDSLISEVKSVDGTFIPLWHNHSLHNRYAWKNWRSVFEKMIKKALD